MDTLRGTLPRTVAAIAADATVGLHDGFQLFVSHRGQIVADVAFGHAAPGVPATPQTLFCWLSSGKPLTAAAVGLLWQRGAVRLDDRVADHVPEFAAGGKAAVTLRHLLTHTGGFPNADPNYPGATWDDSVAAVCATPLEPDWSPGVTAGYHVSGSWFVLGEVIRRVSGRPFERFLREELLGPLGMTDTHFSLTPEQAAGYGNRLGHTRRRVKRDSEPLDWHQPPRVSRASPGSSARGPVRDLGRFYESLRTALTGEPHPLSPHPLSSHPLSSQTVEALVSPHRVGVWDRTFQHIVDFGLGFVTDSNRHGPDTVPYGFGRHASPRAFGHGGAQSSIGFADPVHGLAVAWAADTLTGEPRHNTRNRAINTAIYEDLGLG